jgi:hypothetical protein
MFTCESCNYSTKIKCNYLKHLNTKKHKKRSIIIEETDTINEKSIKMTPNDPKMTPNLPKMTPNDPKLNKKYSCDYCEISFSTKAHKRRHEMHKCNNEGNPRHDNILEKLENEKKELYNYIDKLIDKVGNTTNNNTNNTYNTNNNINIHLNNFGEEDISHLTAQIMTALIKGPCKMIQNAIKFIHFNENKPENNNICITNVKSKHIKVYKNNKWCYENKQEAIEDMIDKNYNILDEHYEYNGKEELSEFEKERYREFQEFFDNQDKKLHSKLKNESELLLLNESKCDVTMIDEKKD